MNGQERRYTVAISTPPASRIARAARRQTDQAILDAAHDAGYLTIGDRSPRRIRLRNAWATHCERVQIPFVVVETRRRYAQVELDLIFQRPRPGERSCWCLSEENMHAIYALLQEHNRTRTRVSAGPVFSYGYDIPLDLAPFVAQRLYEIALADVGGVR